METPSFIAARLLQGGYAVVSVDVRGTGASFGNRSIDWSREEVADSYDIMDWIVSQPWSDGAIGAYGISYESNAAELAASTKHPALRAVALISGYYDLQSNLVQPGGVFNDAIVSIWGQGTAQQDQAMAAASVDSDGNKQVLKSALEGRQNYNTYNAIKSMTFVDDEIVPGYTIKDISPAGYVAAIEESGVAIYVRTGWMDGATSDGAIARLQALSNLQQVVIGPWGHGGMLNYDPLLKVQPLDESNALASDIVAFFDQNIKSQQSLTLGRSLSYYTFGEGSWKTTDVWPPAGTQELEWYFGEGRSLVQEKPKESSGSDPYQVDYTTTTGSPDTSVTNRWFSALGARPIKYPDRQNEDQKLLCYTSEPLARDLEITGTPVVELYIASDAPDVGLHVYLEIVSDDGSVTYLTEGVFRAINRAVSESPSYPGAPEPYHSFLKVDATPLNLGEIVKVEFPMCATSALLKKGQRLRVAVAGYDTASFERIPADGDTTINVVRSAGRASLISIPSIWR